MLFAGISANKRLPWRAKLERIATGFDKWTEGPVWTRVRSHDLAERGVELLNFLRNRRHHNNHEGRGQEKESADRHATDSTSNE